MRCEGVIQLLSITVMEHGEDVIFLRKIMPGGADKSFGVHVARLAGRPPRRWWPGRRKFEARLEAQRHQSKHHFGQNILEKGKRKNRQTGYV